MNMKHLYTSLDSGVTSGSVTDNSITDDSVIEIYFNNTDCYIDSTSQSGHTVYFTVGGNATGTNVCVVVNNLTNFTPYDDTNIANRVSSLESEVETLDNVVTTLETDVETLETRVDGLNANNINYDEHSTLYSAMGDIDELETTSKNLVGAINEVKESGGGLDIKTKTISGITNANGFLITDLSNMHNVILGMYNSSVSGYQYPYISTANNSISINFKNVSFQNVVNTNASITILYMDV